MTSSPTRKECKSCGQQKPLTEFYYHSGKRAYQQPCKECVSIKAKKARDPKEIRRKNLWQNFKVTPEQFDNWLMEQGHVCAICGNPETHTWRGKPRELCVDHDHATGKVRKLLCHKCNTLIGLAREDVSILLAAVQYLEKEVNGSTE